MRVEDSGTPAGAPTGDNALVVTEGNRIERDRIWVQRTSVGYVCVGFAPTARIARFAFDGEGEGNLFFTACRRIDSEVVREGRSKADRLGLKVPLNRFNDPALRRLAIADKLIKEGFDPDEPRDAHGEWTSGGGSASAGAAVATTVASVVADVGSDLASTWRLWTADALAALPRVAAGLNIFTLAGGLILIPGNRSGDQQSSGNVPNTDIQFRQIEKLLVLTEPDGTSGFAKPIYSAVPDADGFYRDQQGNIIGRYLGDGNGVVLDPAAVTALSVRGPRRRRDADADADAGSDSDSDAQAAARAKSIAKDEPQLCPDPGPDRPGNKSPRAIEYQQQITGLEPGLAILFNGVMFDGCRTNDGTLLEAKGPGFLFAVVDPNAAPSASFWKPWYDGREEADLQMRNQSAAAGPRMVEWHCAEKPVADYFRWYAEANHLDNIRVIWTPYISQERSKMSSKSDFRGFTPVPWWTYRTFSGREVRP